jgi:type II secretory pathway component GspD/PulD (secretin)
MVKVKNGQTIVIAGLITDKISESTRKVPLLGDIPLLGNIFRQTVQDKTKSELVIFLTPFILNDKSVEDIRKEHEERLRKAGRTFEPVPEIRQKPSEE